MNLNEIVKIFTFDAKFDKFNGNKHYKKRINENDIPKNMTKQEYLNKCERISLKNLNGSTVRAFKLPDGRINKYDDESGWLVSYTNKNGALITGMPFRGGMIRFERMMESRKGKELTKE